MQQLKKMAVGVFAAVLVCASLPVYAVEPEPDSTSTEVGMAAAVDFLVVDKPCLEPGETQNIVLSIGEEDIAVTSAALSYHRESDGAVFKAEASRIEGGALLFEISCPEGCDADAYWLDSVAYEIDGMQNTMVFSEVGIEAGYGVSKEVATNPDGYLVDEETSGVESGVVSYGATGNQISENSIGEAIAAEQAQIPMTMAASSSGSVVVVLDPGHDSTHTGASYGGLREENLNLKIAQYCKAELEEYNGVKVYMTRTTEACPFPGESNSDDLAGRVDYAASVGADVYVSLHLNANNDTTVSGSQVYCPNTNYNSSISQEGFSLADQIMAQLNKLGLSNRGVYSVNSSSTKYPDGSWADYYAVIRRSKLAGFPGIIVEHAFMSNSSDLNNYLSSEASLKSLGVADATGIANYFGLTKDLTDIVLDPSTGQWVYQVNGVTDYTHTGVDQNEYGWWYVKDGVVDFSYTGFAENSYGWWYIENGQVIFNTNTVLQGVVNGQDGWWYVVGGQVQTAFTGVANHCNDYGWWYVKNGKVDFSANTVAQNDYGWWYVEGGKVVFSYNGFAQNQYGWWYIEGGKVIFATNSVLEDLNKKIDGTDGWWYVVGGQVQTGFTGVGNYCNDYGWWYIKNGKVDFSANTVAQNNYGWWYVTGGKVQFGFTGLGNYCNDYGWWYIKDGKVDFSANTVAQNNYGWWYVTSGKVQFGFTGVGNYCNDYGWWYIKDGKVDFSANTVAQNNYGWWYVSDGKVQFGFNGIAQNQYGWWYIKSGKVDFSYNGSVTDNGTRYSVENGKVAK